LAVLGAVLWLIPPIAIAINLLALRRINRYWPGLVGRPIAWAGLALAIIAAVAAPTRLQVRDWLLATEGQRIAELFFELLRDDKPELAYQLTPERNTNLPFGGALWAQYRANAERMDSVRSFVDEPAVRALLELGPRATVRFFANEEHQQIDNQDGLVRLYAVTYQDKLDKPRTFFVRIVLVRKRDVYGNYAWWVRAVGPVHPKDWLENAAS
jgi:hypothetical protein